MLTVFIMMALPSLAGLPWNSSSVEGSFTCNGTDSTPLTQELWFSFTLRGSSSSSFGYCRLIRTSGFSPSSTLSIHTLGSFFSNLYPDSTFETFGNHALTNETSLNR
jgi:hypothetical protein